MATTFNKQKASSYWSSSSAASKSSLHVLNGRRKTNPSFRHHKVSSSFFPRYVIIFASSSCATTTLEQKPPCWIFNNDVSVCSKNQTLNLSFHLRSKEAPVRKNDGLVFLKYLADAYTPMAVKDSCSCHLRRLLIFIFSAARRGFFERV